jgi:flagellar hook-basal body complex protein FliE
LQVIRALQAKAHDTKTCALLIYALQTASANLKQLAREQQEAEYMNGPSFAEILLQRLDEYAEQDRAAAQAAADTLPKAPPATAAVGLNPRTEAAGD